MWIFSKVGFFSITKSPVETDKMQIRARERNDLETLMAATGISERIVETPTADYLYRILLEPEICEKVLVHLFRQIDYGNFKNAVHDTPGQENKSGPYMRVWSAMASLQPVDKPAEDGQVVHASEMFKGFPIDLTERAFDNPRATEKAGKKTAKRKDAITKAVSKGK